MKDCEPETMKLIIKKLSEEFCYMLAFLVSYAINCRSLVVRLLLIGSGKVKH